MAIKETTIGETFTDDQKKMIALYEEQIDNKLLMLYEEGKKLDVKPEPYPYLHHSKKEGDIPYGEDERVIGEILRKYREAGWLIKWKFNDDGQSGNWVFSLKKIEDTFDFVKTGKNLKISFTHKYPKSGVTKCNLIISILGACKTKIVSENKEDQIEYVNFCMPSNLYITEVNIIKFVRYYNKEKRWAIYLEDGVLVSENLKVEII